MVAKSRVLVAMGPRCGRKGSFSAKEKVASNK